MTDERPLHVRVWEAFPQNWYPEKRDGTREPIVPVTYPLYDTDWSAAGPLVQRYGISLRMDGNAVYCKHRFNPPCHWTSEQRCRDKVLAHSCGRTPLEAVCHLILALKESGKL